MAIDPSIIGNVMVPRAPQMPDVNAMMQTRTAGMENVYKIERQRQADAPHRPARAKPPAESLRNEARRRRHCGTRKGVGHGACASHWIQASAGMPGLSCCSALSQWLQLPSVACCRNCWRTWR